VTSQPHEMGYEEVHKPELSLSLSDTNGSTSTWGVQYNAFLSPTNALCQPQIRHHTKHSNVLIAAISTSTAAGRGNSRKRACRGVEHLILLRDRPSPHPCAVDILRRGPHRKPPIHLCCGMQAGPTVLAPRVFIPKPKSVSIHYIQHYCTLQRSMQHSESKLS
jgi:hypothetical protein